MSETKILKIEKLNARRARFVYEAARIAAIAANAPIVPDGWEHREKPFRDQFLEVIYRQCGPNRKRSPKQLHDDWTDEYLRMGWSYGPVYDRDLKIHPDLVPYSQLHDLERDKDAVFVALCEIARKWIKK